MQDWAHLHRTRDVFDFLDEYFDDRVIALDYSTVKRKGMDWPPYSPDLISCDYFLWGTLQDSVYCTNFSTLDELEEAICQVCVSISGDTRKVTDNFILRLRHMCCVKGAHFESILVWYKLLAMTHAAPSIGALCDWILWFLYQIFPAVLINIPLV